MFFYEDGFSLRQFFAYQQCPQQPPYQQPQQKMQRISPLLKKRCKQR